MDREKEPQTFDYDVFLSFRGLDTRRSFTDVLYDSMVNSGIRVFRDDDELSAGQKIDQILLAVENSKICMPIFSQSFASSSWCLREVAKMVELKKEIVPVFYDVTPEDVKLRTPVYGTDMEKLEEKHGKDQVKLWADALKEVARIKGRELQNKGYSEFIKELVRELLIKFKPNRQRVPDYLVGIEDPLNDAMKLLDIESSDARFLGIHGMGGSGKTTLAEVLFNKLSSSFECCSFLADVREKSNRHPIEHLQKKLLSSLNPKLGDTTRIADPMDMIQRNFRRKKVLIILDDVNQKEQIDDLVGKAEYFGPGSRIIVTTRDSRVLRIGHESFRHVIKMGGLKLQEALKLFSWHAFKKRSPTHEYESLSNQLVSACGGLPLSLEVLGSFLRHRDKSIWVEMVKKLEKVPDQKVQETLRISYEALEYGQQQIFLDIALFFNKKEKSYPIYMWDACDFYPALGLDALISLSLVKVVKNDKLWMHDLLVGLGREIVRREGLHYPFKCSRYWDREGGSLNVLKSKEGKEKIVGLRLDGPYHNSSGQDLAGLEKVRFVSLEEENLGKMFNHPLPELNWLSWHHLPSSLKTANLNIQRLAILELPHSSISEKWSGWNQIQMMHLKVLDLTNCNKLTTTPDFSRIPNLERLVLCQCANLVKLHNSIVLLKNLKFVDLNCCSSLSELPEELGCLGNLEQMFLHNCTRLKELPDSLGKLKSLVVLDTSRKVLPVLRLIQFIELRVTGGTASWDEDMDLSLMTDFFDQNIIVQMIRIAKLLKDMIQLGTKSPPMTKLPDTIGDLKVLTKLDLSSTHITHLPEFFGNLENLRELTARWSRLVALPKSIGMLKKLETLNMGLSFLLAEIPAEIGALSSLSILNLLYTSVRELPSTITQLHLLKSLNLTGCMQLGEAAQAPVSSKKQRAGSSKNAQPPRRLHNVTALPTTLVDCSHLEVLELCCEHLDHIPPLPSSLRRLALGQFHQEVTLPNISNIENLTYLSICCIERGSRCENLTCLPASLRELRVFYCTSLPDLSHLKNLRKFVLVGRDPLKEIQGLGQLGSLQELRISHCKSIELLESLSGLKKLKYLSIRKCPSLRGVKGLDRLPLVEKDVHLSGCKCTECSIENSGFSVKRELLSWISEMGIPRSDLPLKVQRYLETPKTDTTSSSCLAIRIKKCLPKLCMEREFPKSE